LSLADWLKSTEKEISSFERKVLFTEMNNLIAMGMSKEDAAKKVAQNKIVELQEERTNIEKVIKDAEKDAKV